MMSKKLIFLMLLVPAIMSTPTHADKLAGLADITVVNDAIVSLRYQGTEYVVADGDLVLGTTTRWYVPAGGVPTLWAEGDPTPAATNTFGAPPKPEDPGSEGDNFFFRLNGANNMSSIDAIDFQETIFPVLTDTIFVFERGGNDTGTYEAILADGSLGAPVSFTAANVYADTGVNVAGQDAFGVVFTTDVRVKGVRITAPGHDCLSISAIPKPLDPGQSRDPQPEDGSTGVSRDVVLSWTPGKYAPAVNGHMVYLSESFNDVNDGIGGIRQSANIYGLGRLEFGTTYYWRVDEVNAPPDSTVFKGNVWSFTTEPVGYAIDGASITVTASSMSEGDFGPEKTIDGSGLDENDLHSIEPTDMWLSSNEPQGAWIQYEFDTIHKLHEMWVWNSNQIFEGLFGFGMRDVTVEYSTNGTDWTALADVRQFTRAPGKDGYAHDTTVDFSGAVAQYVRLTATSNWGGILPQYGLSEVRFFSIPVSAREPSPASGATDVNPDVTLSWRAGREAATHNVSLSTDQQAVIDGSAPAVSVANTSYSTALDLGSTYYWRVDEVNEAKTPTTWQGDVWDFTTQQYIVVEDFEDYNDYPPYEIYTTWVDGYENPTNGSQVGYLTPPSVETTIIHGGRQSMPLLYSNTGGAAYSEATRTFTVRQDWTKYGIQALGIWFYGTAGNTGQLYVKINGSKVAYNGPASDLAHAGWQLWNIDLTTLNMNLQSVSSLAMGIDGNGASGTLYFDDIRLRRAPVGLVLTLAPMGTFETTGNNGTILSMNGISVDALVLGTTTFAGAPASAQFPPQDADNFDLSVGASADNQAYVQTLFAVPVITVFIVEKGGNDSGFIQALDQNGLTVGEMISFSPADFTKTGFQGVQNQAVATAVVTATAPIYGIRVLPPATGTLGFDPTSVSAIPAP